MDQNLSTPMDVVNAICRQVENLPAPAEAGKGTKRERFAVEADSDGDTTGGTMDVDGFGTEEAFVADPKGWFDAYGDGAKMPDNKPSFEESQRVVRKHKDDKVQEFKSRTGGVSKTIGK